MKGYTSSLTLKQRLAGIILAIVMVIAMMPALGFGGFTAYAESEGDVVKDGCKFHLWYEETGASVALKEYNGTATQIKLPDSVSIGGHTYPASSEENWYMLYASAFSGNTQITKIAIPNGYDTIAAGSFNGCTSLTELAIGDSVSSLGYEGDAGAFTGCPATTYYFKGENVSQNDVEKSGIGTDANGNPIAGVTVWTKAGSNVDKAIEVINVDKPDGYKINVRYNDDPYSLNTVDPSAPPANKETKGEDGTAYGKGASASVVEKAILALKTDSDPKGTKFGLLQAKAKKVGKNYVTLSWNGATGAVKYVVYGNTCNAGSKKYKYVKLTTTSQKSIKFTKVNNKAVKKGTYYKFIVVALDKNNKVVSTSKTVHAATTGGKVGNDKSVTTKAKKNKVTVKKGKSFKLGAKAVPKSKKLKVKKHRGLCYESSNPQIATVSSKGVIKGKKKGKCTVYVYAQNGVSKAIKVTVK